MARVHAAVKKHHNMGYMVVVVGDRDHPEVMGILGYTDGRGIVINSPDEVSSLPDVPRLLVVAQTTYEKETFNEILDVIKDSYPDSEIKAIDTICDSTLRRQDEVRELARRVDAVVVVGGRESGNTKRLFNVARESGVPAYHVEDETELDPDELSRYKTLGLTAGASTPNWVIMRVADYLGGLDRDKRGRFLRLIRSTLRFIAMGHIYTALAAGGLATAASILMGVNSFWTIPLISGFYIYSMHVLNRLADRGTLRFNDPAREEFYTKYRPYLATLCVVSFVISSTLALMINLTAFLLLIVAALFGVSYSVKVVPEVISKFTKYRRLKDIPASKTSFVAGAWAGVSSAMPYLSSYEDISFVSFFSVFTFCFLMVFIRVSLYDIRDIQGDAIVGRETMPIIIGKDWTRRLLIFLNFIVFLLLIISAIMDIVTPLGFLLLVIPLYSLLVLYLYHQRVIFQGAMFELVVDFEFILAGGLALVWFLI